MFQSRTFADYRFTLSLSLSLSLGVRMSLITPPPPGNYVSAFMRVRDSDVNKRNLPWRDNRDCGFNPRAPHRHRTAPRTL